MKTTSWGWRPDRPEGIWKHGCKWARPLVAAAPWITLSLLLAMFSFINGNLSRAPGLVFDMPDPVMGDGTDGPTLAAIVVQVARDGGVGRETLVFFDDERFNLSDEESMTRFRECLGERAAADPSRTLLLLSDGNIAYGQLAKLIGVARDAEVEHVQIAEKRE